MNHPNTFRKYLVTYKILQDFPVSHLGKSLLTTATRMINLELFQMHDKKIRTLLNLFVFVESLLIETLVLQLARPLKKYISVTDSVYAFANVR